MNLAAFKSTISQKLKFQFQQIVDAEGKQQNWIEMLYRPHHLHGCGSVDHFFKSLTTQQKVDLDINIFSQLPEILCIKKPSRLSINLMPISLLSAEFRRNFDAMISDNEIDSSKVCLEIVETQSMPPLGNNTINLLHKFRANGGWIALDDFGSGSAHWELLQTGLIDVLKVANQNILKNRITESYTRGLSQLAHSMKLKTVLEGVETQDDFDLGINQGYKNFQGWFFNKEPEAL